MKSRKSFQEIVFAVFLLAAMILLFFWFTERNSEWTEEQNKNYAADSARMKSQQINDELNNALSRIETYAYFVGESLYEPVVTPDVLKKMEEHSQFDAILFTDRSGVDYTSDGRTSDVRERYFFHDGISGNSNIDIVFESHFFDETMACFYAPVRYEGEIIGVLRGAFLAEEYLKNMLVTTYFGEEALVYLCSTDGRVISSSNGIVYDKPLFDALSETGVIDEASANQVQQVFENGGEGAFLCDSSSKTDNIYVSYLPNSDYVFVQTFPKMSHSA